jgi:hypothetical protein
VSSTPTNLTASALLLKRVAIAFELARINVFLRFGLLAAEDGGIVRDLDVDGEVFPFVTIPARVYKAKELADVVPVGHDVDRSDVERRMRYIQRAEERFEGAVWVSRGVLSNVDMASVLLQSEGAVRRGPQVWTARDRDGGCDSRRFDPVIGCEVLNVSD